MVANTKWRKIIRWAKVIESYGKWSHNSYNNKEKHFLNGFSLVDTHIMGALRHICRTHSYSYSLFLIYLYLYAFVALCACQVLVRRDDSFSVCFLNNFYAFTSSPMIVDAIDFRQILIAIANFYCSLVLCREEKRILSTHLPHTYIRLILIGAYWIVARLHVVHTFKHYDLQLWTNELASGWGDAP